MQTTPLPAGVIKRIERITRDFIWGATNESRKCNLVAWDVVTRDKEHGGLGIKKLEHMNLAFLAKLGWRLINEDESTWAKIMRAKYTNDNPDPNTWLPKSHSSIAWKGILKTIPILKKGQRKLIRNGRETRFWLDIWVGHRPLVEVTT